MDDLRTAKDRALVRDFTSHRLQEQVLALVYEQLWPVARARSRASRSRPPAEALPNPARQPLQTVGG